MRRIKVDLLAVEERPRRERGYRPLFRPKQTLSFVILGSLRGALLPQQERGELLPGEREGGQGRPAEPLRGLLPAVGRVEASVALVPRPGQPAARNAAQDGRLLSGARCRCPVPPLEKRGPPTDRDAVMAPKCWGVVVEDRST